MSKRVEYYRDLDKAMQLSIPSQVQKQAPNAVYTEIVGYNPRRLSLLLTVDKNRDGYWLCLGVDSTVQAVIYVSSNPSGDSYIRFSVPEDGALVKQTWGFVPLTQTTSCGALEAIGPPFDQCNEDY